MKVINQHNRYIIDERHTEKIKELVKNGYGNTIIDDVKVTYEDEYEVDGEQYIVVHIGNYFNDADEDFGL